MVYLKKHLKKLQVSTSPTILESVNYSVTDEKKTVLVFDKCFFVGNLTNPNTVPGVVKN